MNLLVTGCAGFIGYHLSKKMLSEGHTVFGIDNLNSYYDLNLKKERLKYLGIDIDNGRLENGNFKFLQLDLCDKDGLQRLFSLNTFGKVINLAAQAGVRYSIEQPQEYIQSNVIGFFNLLECCRKYSVNQLIYASSSSIYGNSQQNKFNETDKTDSPESLYAATKKSNELMATAYHNLFGLSVIGLRFFTVYGPFGRPDMAPMIFADAILSNKPIKVFNNGQMWRDFTYIDDLVERLMLVVSSSDKQCEIYNIGSSRPILLNEFIRTLEDSLGKGAKKDFLPIQQGDVVKTYASMDKFEKDFGTSYVTPFEYGIRNFAKWFMNFYKKKYK